MDVTLETALDKIAFACGEELDSLVSVIEANRSNMLNYDKAKVRVKPKKAIRLAAAIKKQYKATAI